MNFRLMAAAFGRNRVKTDRNFVVWTGGNVKTEIDVRRLLKDVIRGSLIDNEEIVMPLPDGDHENENARQPTDEELRFYASLVQEVRDELALVDVTWPRGVGRMIVDPFKAFERDVLDQVDWNRQNGH